MITIYINRNGLRWRDAPTEYSLPKTQYNRWKRWSEKGVFVRMLMELARENGDTDSLMIDATHLKTHRLQPWAEKRGRRRVIRRTKGGMNTKLHAVCDSRGCPLDLFVTAGQPFGTLLRNALSVSGSAMTSAHGRY